MSTAVNIQNEEDVKNKIVIPYLEELGFLKEELDYEINFHLNFGKNVFSRSAKKTVDSANARLDILVKHQGKNICIFEVKRDTVKISDNDIKQVVSYGSLARPMVPFCIVTNGKDSVLVDTISGEPFKKEDIARYTINGYKVTLPDEIYYDRLKYFIGYSKENLMMFCQGQTSLYMKALKGSKDERHKKYIKEIYEPPKKLTELLNTFVCQSDLSSFVLVAKSGMGKTCWTCHTTESLLESGIPTLFYRANDIKKGIFEAIKEDLNWTFPSQFNVTQGMKRFFEVFQDETVFIVVDGIDEIEINLARDLTEDFFRRIKNRNVKFITSCKTEVWPSLLTKDEIPLQISEETLNKGFILDELEEEQFYSMIEKYRQFFNFKGLFQDQVLKDCKRNLYLLRVMFEVAYFEQNENLTYTSASFFKRYYQRIMNHFTRDESGSIELMLRHLGTLLYENNSDYVDMQEVRKIIGLSPLESLPSRLFDLSILDRREGAHSEEVGFYFQRFRDYIISFRVLQWHRLSAEMFGKQQDDRLGISGVKLNVLELYYTLSSEEHKRILDRPIYDIAHDYVSFYEKFIDTHFPSMKNNFTPKTKGEIGFVGYFDISKTRMIAHAFRSIDATDSKVLLIPASGKGALKDNNLDYLYGVEMGMRMRYPSIFNEQMNVAEEVIAYDIPRELENIIKKGKLNEDDSIPLIQEKLFAVGYSLYPEYVGVDLRFSDVVIKGFPLAKLKEGVLAKRALRILEDELIQNKIKNEKLTFTRQEIIISISEEERNYLREKANQIGKEGVFYHQELRNSNDDFEGDILNTIAIMGEIGIKEIYDPLAVRREEFPKFNELYKGYKIDIDYAESFFSELLSIGLTEYRNLIEKNFLIFKEVFKIYRDSPLTFFISISKSHRQKSLIYTVRICKPLDNENYIYSVKIAHVNRKWDFENERTIEKKKYKIKKYKIIQGFKGNFQDFLKPSLNFSSFKSKDYLFCVRSLAYMFIAEDCNEILKFIADKYGVKLKRQMNFNQPSY